jgi:DNA-binding response OmpR family regulator
MGVSGECHSTVTAPPAVVGHNAPVPFLLLIEDDDAIRTGLELALTRQGHRVVAAASGEEGLERLREQRPDLIVLDVMLPGIDGFEVCRRIRRTDQLPIILLTARSDDIDIVVGLESGADDYVIKPIQPRVLDARIRAVLRRGERDSSDAVAFGAIVIDRSAMTVTKDGQDLQLTPTELRLLLELSRRPGQALSRQQLLRLVWEHDYLGDSRLVDACVQRLRAKVEDVPSAPKLIRTVRGVGYRLDAPA